MVVGLEAMERRDVRVVERGEHARLALEARQALGVVRHLVEQELDRHLAAERVSRARYTAPMPP